MGLVFTASEVLDLCELVLEDDLLLDSRRDDERGDVRAELQTDFARFTIVCSVMEDSQVLHIWAWLPFDVENEQDALTMAVACHALNGYMILGKYTYNLEKDVALELDHFYGDGIDMDAVRRLLEGIFRPSLEEDGQRLIDLYNGTLPFDRFLTLIQE